MNKKIIRVIVFYEDGTFSDIAADLAPKFDIHKPIPRVPSPFTTPISPGCAKCGSFTTGSCGKLDCPNGYTNPWNNSPKITD